MKEIKAYIKPHKLSAVTLELNKIEKFPGMSICEVRGFGATKGKYESTDQDESLNEYEPHIKIEIVCDDLQETSIVDVIKQTAHTGLRGDGNIYVYDVQKVIRINEEDV